MAVDQALLEAASNPVDVHCDPIANLSNKLSLRRPVMRRKKYFSSHFLPLRNINNANRFGVSMSRGS
jgi:hypothetical protein